MDFTILGKTQLFVNGRSVELGPTKQRALLALLLLQVNKPVSVKMIVEQLWPGRSPDQVKGGLHSTISRLRSVLKTAGVPYRLPREHDTYRLVLDPALIDYHRFRRTVERAQHSASQGDHATVRGLLRSALAMWPGPALVEIQSDWARSRRQQMTETDLLPAYYALFDSMLALREYGEVLREIRALTDEHPHDETLAKQSILALAGAGRHNDALSFFVTFRQRYVSEFGATPAPDLVETYRKVLRSREVTASAGFAPVAPQKLLRGPSSMVGREDLLDALDALLPTAGAAIAPRVLALQGMPGVGKTSLGLHWARRNLHHFPDGQLFANLYGYGAGKVSAADAMSGFLFDLGVPVDLIPADVTQRAGKLNQRLAGRQALVFLDNVADSAHVRPLLDAISNCFVLLTSRSRLSGLMIRDGVDGLTVRPLTDDVSVALLREHIGDQRADEDPDAVQELATLSSGLPLALRIIGHYIEHRPQTRLCEVAQELDSHSALVTMLADSDDEAATVPGAFSLSYNALPPTTARLFRRLGLHPSPVVSGPAAAALLGEDAPATDTHLKYLTAMFLLEPEGLHVYRMHDLIHAYAADRAKADEPADDAVAARTKMVNWYFRTAEVAKRILAPHSQPIPELRSTATAVPLTFDDDQEAIRWCDQQRSNLIAVIRCAAEHNLHDYAWRMVASLWEPFERSGFKDDFLDVLPVGLEAARTLGDKTAESGMLNTLGRNHFGRRDYRQALTYFNDGLAAATDAGSSILKAASRHNIACARLELGQTRTALDIYENVLEIHRADGERTAEAYTLHRLGDVYQRRDDPEKAIAHYHQSLTIRRQIGHIRGQADSLSELGKIHYKLGQQDEALGYSFRALALHERSHDNVKEAETLTTLAALHNDSQEYPESIRYARQAITLARFTEDCLACATALEILGRSQLATGDKHGAKRSWTEALAIFDVASHPAADAVRDGLRSVAADTAGNVDSPDTPG